MDSIHSWIDQEELTKLAEGLTGEVKIKDWNKDDVEQSADASQLNKDEQSSSVPQEMQESLAKASEAANQAGIVKAKAEILEQPEELDNPQEAEQPEPVDHAEVPEVLEVKEPEVAKLVQAGAVEIEKPASAEVEQPEHEVARLEPTELPTDTPIVLPDVSAAEGVQPEVEEAVALTPIGTFAEMDQKMTNAIAAQGICVTDRDGDVLYESFENDQLVEFVVATLQGSPLLQVTENQLGNMRLKISAGSYMEFTSVMSTRGVLVASAIVGKPLKPETVKQIAAEMQRIANDDN